MGVRAMPAAEGSEAGCKLQINALRGKGKGKPDSGRGRSRSPRQRPYILQPRNGVDERLRRSRSRSPRGRGGGEGKGKSKGTGCFNCGASDHRARECPAKQNRQPRPEPRWRSEGRTPRTVLVRQIHFQLRHGIGKDKGETASIHEL